MAKDSLLNIILNIVKQGTGDKDATNGMADLEKQLGDTTTSLLGSVVGFTTLSGAIYAGVAAIKASVDAAAEDETALSRLNMTIQSTGRSGEISAAGLDKMAASPLFDTAQINEAANTLMRFVDIPSQQMPKDMLVIENMADAFGGLNGASQAFGMAMETGRTRGMGFSREITNQISLLATHGDTAQMDALILDQLTQKYSGQAATAMDTYAGKQQQVKVASEELKAAIGDELLPGLKAVDDYVLKSLAGWQQYADYLALVRTPAGGLKQDTENLTEAEKNQANATGVNITYYKNYIATLKSKIAAEQESVNIANAVTSAIKNQDDVYTEATQVTDIFTGALIDQASAAKQESSELNFVVSFAKQYETNLNKVSDAEQKVSDDEATLAALQKQGWGAASTKILDAKAALEKDSQALKDAQKASKDATNEMIAGFLQAQLSADGLFSADDVQKVLNYRMQVGLLTTDEYNAAMEAMAIADNLAGIEDKTVTLTVIQQNITEQENQGQATASPPTGSKKPAAAVARAGGGPIAPNSYIYNEDPGSRPETFVAGGGYMLTKQDAQAALGGGVTIQLYVNGAGDPAAVAREVIRQLGATVNLQGARTRL
jgi:hypothetical protein